MIGAPPAATGWWWRPGTGMLIRAPTSRRPGPSRITTTWPLHCVAGTPGAAWHPDLRLPADAVVVSKGGHPAAFSGFEGHDERAGRWPMCSRAGVDAIDVVGIATSYCVRATALDAARPASAPGCWPAWSPTSTRRSRRRAGPNCEAPGWPCTRSLERGPAIRPGESGLELRRHPQQRASSHGPAPTARRSAARRRPGRRAARWRVGPSCSRPMSAPPSGTPGGRRALRRRRARRPGSHLPGAARSSCRGEQHVELGAPAGHQGPGQALEVMDGPYVGETVDGRAWARLVRSAVRPAPSRRRSRPARSSPP